MYDCSWCQRMGHRWHIDWALVAVFGATSVPLSFLGARVAMRVDAHLLERLYGVALVLLGVVFLIIS